MNEFRKEKRLAFARGGRVHKDIGRIGTRALSGRSVGLICGLNSLGCLEISNTVNIDVRNKVIR